MARYEITTVVSYTYEVEADDLESAEKQGWDYEDYQSAGVVDSIEVYEYPEDEEESE